MKSLGSRVARLVNRVFRRQGPVLDGRYHLRPLRTPKEVRRALAYVLLNSRKHWVERFRLLATGSYSRRSELRWLV